MRMALKRSRVRAIIATEQAPLEVFDHEGDAIRNDYASQSLAAVWAERIQLRRESLALMEGWTDEQWHRVGVHPEAGPVDLLQLGMQMPHLVTLPRDLDA